MTIKDIKRALTKFDDLQKASYFKKLDEIEQKLIKENIEPARDILEEILGFVEKQDIINIVQRLSGYDE
jgi:hypothetical protein